jgi:hypothetical protein
MTYTILSRLPLRAVDILAQRQEARRATLARIFVMITFFGAFALSGCGESSTHVKPDARTRHNELHITIHQDANEKDPIVGWAIENGTPSKNTFRASVRFLEWSTLGTADHPSACAIVIEKVISGSPDEVPETDDPTFMVAPDSINLAQPTTEQSYTIPCSERTKSTQILWPRASVAILGHIAQGDSEDTADDDSTRWHFVIDEIPQAPRVTQLDDPRGSLVWTTPSPSPNPSEVSIRSKTDGLACFSALGARKYDIAASSCGRAADDFDYAANHISGARATPSDVGTLVIVSVLYRKAKSLALHELGRDKDSRDAFEKGGALLRALLVTPGCSWCQSEAKKSLRKYGEWPPHDYEV